MKSYINYIKRQNKNVQDIHAVIFATTATIIIASIYLQWQYHIFYPEYTEVIYVKENRNTLPIPAVQSGGLDHNNNFLKDFMGQKSGNNTSNTIDLFINIINNAKVNFIDKI